MARKRNKNLKIQKKKIGSIQSPEVRGGKKKRIEIIRFIYVVFIV
jgi:hypothetical protein